MKDMST